MENKNEINYDLFSVKDKVIALIGCTGILGARYTELFASLGAKVVMGDLDYDRCSKLAIEMEEKYNADVYPVLVDITDEKMIANYFQELLGKYKKIDILINNTQVKPEGFYASFENYSKDTLVKVLDGNLIGITLACKEACKMFLDQGYGIIVNVSSIYGIVAPDQRLYEGVENIYFPLEDFSSPVSYSISKAGVVQLTKYLASYYREKNIRVNCLTPGGVYDNHDEIFNKQYSYRTILGRMADKNEYNGAILFLCSDASSYMTGSNMIIDGGWSAI